jgi:RNA polymerase sigma factor (sigma-70 family)
MEGRVPQNAVRSLPDQTSIHVQQAIAGDPQSIGWVIAHFQPLCKAQVRLRIGMHAGPEDVDDLLSELWLVTLRRLPELRPREGRYAPVLVRFLGSTALNLCNNFLRARIRRKAGWGADEHPNGGPVDELADETRGVVSRAIAGEVHEQVERCLLGLDATKRDVLVLRLMEQRTNKEIAATLRLEPNTVAVRYRRALEELRRCLPKELFQDLRHVRR